MKLEQVEVTIGNDGKVKIQTSGFSGDACLDATEDLEQLLGNLLVERERTAESYDQTGSRTAEQVKIRR